MAVKKPQGGNKITALPTVEPRTPLRRDKRPRSNLTAQQAKFLDAYLASYSATQAARAIGVEEAECSARGHVILSHEHVQRALTRRLADAGINPTKVKAELAAIAFAGPDSAWAAINGFASLKLKCLEYLARLVGMEGRTESAAEAKASRQQSLTTLLIDNPDRIEVSSVVGLKAHEVGYSPEPPDEGA